MSILVCFFVFVVEVLFSFFIVFVDFSKVHWFSSKIKVSDYVGRYSFSFTVFGRNFLAGNVHSRVTMDRHVHALH